MKTNVIIAPTDFSSASHNAILFAAEICRRSSSVLLLVNVSPKRGEEPEATQALESIMSDLKRTGTAELQCEYMVAQGNLTSTLKKIIIERQPKLVVMGTKGASGLKRIIIGSNTVNVLSKIKTPVLVIPERATFEDFRKKNRNRVVLATDLFELKTMNTLAILKEIALLIYQPKVRVLNVRPKHTQLHQLTKLERSALLHYFNPELESERVTIFGTNVLRGIRYYLDHHQDIALVAMVARDSGSLIEKHFTHEMASHTDYPLLVLHDVRKV
jgi:nucleotide-binding universal stress UspA family protein